ncbi:uncharacterized protein LOC108834892 [Raphanus sativus]|uniref:Uncharacterized protein LOC108834892 n=1 Tax=Raphanus sativus TaxID=3726 RepID=A0A6J0LV90_RAPSA|nr:uncharacterized protein LOC108834892 [Raphanus sativus]
MAPNFPKEKAKGDVAVKFYSDLFKSSNPPPFAVSFHDMHPRVTDQMNEELTKPVSVQEVQEALFSINPSKAPGPDGMSALFYQKFWSIVQAQVVREVQRFFEEGILPKEWNYTHLCLIPKIQDPESISDLRPISLCSVMYKIISKVMAKRIVPVLQVIISPTQSAFVSERLMTYNITIAHEMIHSLGDSQDCNSDKMVVKTDMSKAYDRVEWGYLRSLMCALGFDQKWIFWVMKCVSSVTYSVLINDQPHGVIVPQRGLRQGDPLSPALFVLCSEGLNHLLTRAESGEEISGIKFGLTGPSINQLHFADDCLFACQANAEQSHNLINILTRYEQVTGQKLNPAKSSIIFGKSVREAEKGRIKTVLGIEKEGGMDKYLGIPEIMKGSKIKLFSYLKERMNNKISGWHAKHLSQGGKEVLIKAVASALPVLPMSVYQLPKTVISGLSSEMARFWWDGLAFKRKIHWMSWEKLCLSKEDGGMGFRELECFNQALLAKQAWRMIQFEDCLMARVLKGKYFGEKRFLDVRMGNKVSYAWKSILFGRELLQKGLKYSVGDGRDIHVWSEPWMEDEDGTCRPPYRKQRVFDANLKVSDVIDFPKRRWNKTLLDELFVPSDVQILLRNQPSVFDRDSWVWKSTPSGLYTVKTGYELAFSVNKKELLRYALHARGMKGDVVCQTCGLDGESINHVLFSCTLARQIWAQSGFPHPPGGFHDSSIFANVSYLLQAWRFLYNGVQTCIKAFDEARLWFLAQDVAQQSNAENSQVITTHSASCIAPPIDFVKCTIGMRWSKKSKEVGAACVLSDAGGMTLLHSRRSFAGVWSKEEAYFLSLVWAVESMLSHKCLNVYFTLEWRMLVNAINRPKAWPSFKFKVTEIRHLLGELLAWRVVFERSEGHRDASLIANSVIIGDRFQSYVARGAPRWL